MKHANKLWLILAVIALIGFVVISCDNGNGNGACTNHTWGAWQNITKQPNCTETGIGTRTCTNCGTVDTNTTIPTNNDHNFADNWILTTPADWHNNTTNECVGEETLTCTQCPDTNGTRSICKGTQGLVFLSVNDDEAYELGNNFNLGIAQVCIPDYRDDKPVVGIGDLAFEDEGGCEILESIRIGVNVTYIGLMAFSQCKNLETVTFAEGSQLETIGVFTFELCTSLASITIPASVIFIDRLAFYGCTNLEIVTVLATTPPELGELAFYYWDGDEGVLIEGLTIRVPASSVNAYKTNPDWEEYADIIVAIE